MKRTLLLAMLVVLTSVPAFAQPHDGPPRGMEHGGMGRGGGGDDLGIPDIEDDGPGGGRGGRGSRLAEKLNLSPEQRKQIRDIKGDRDEQEKQLLKMKLARLELKELIGKDDAKDEEIVSRAEAISKAMVDQNMQRVKRLLAVRRILTPEQRKNFREFMQERRDDMKQRGGFQGAGQGPGGLRDGMIEKRREKIREGFQGRE